jgi:hypothetical protein
MTQAIRHCEQCGASSATVLVDTYNEDGDGNGGRLVCDDCICAAANAADKRTSYAMPNRPEGYYHCAPGTFE